MRPPRRPPLPVKKALLRRMPLPLLRDDDDKEARGRVLAIGGSRKVPGALLLAGTACLRAGAGKLQLATIAEAAIPLGIAVPEALVMALPAARDGEIDGAAAARQLESKAEAADAVLVGPGMLGGNLRALVSVLVRSLGDKALLVVDGAAIGALSGSPRLLEPLAGRVVITPHAGEMAALLDVSRREVQADPLAIARRAAELHGATVLLKGGQSWVATPDGAAYRFSGNCVGLGTSGSGDTLAGIVAGLGARGASPLVATLWGAWVHAQAGRRLVRRHADVGFLARELPGEVPAALARLCRPPVRGRSNR